MNKRIVQLPQRTTVPDQRQGQFELRVDRHLIEDGIGMGVLGDGTSFLNQRGLADLCGVRNKYVGLMTADWSHDGPSSDTKRVREILSEGGSVPSSMAHEVFYGKQRLLAYPEDVCMAVLEFFAFEKGWAGEEIALRNFRRLGRHGLRKFIYTRVGYAGRADTDVWQIFKDRVSLTYDAVPAGYFSVFKELGSLIITLGLTGLHIDENFVPDISVGQAWGHHWRDAKLMDRFGDKRSYAHCYPEYFPQAASNPQMANCYPDDALGEFRRWFREDYIGEGRFRRYLAKKVSDRLLPEGYVEKALLALTKD